MNHETANQTSDCRTAPFGHARRSRNHRRLRGEPFDIDPELCDHEFGLDEFGLRHVNLRDLRHRELRLHRKLGHFGLRLDRLQHAQCGRLWDGLDSASGWPQLSGDERQLFELSQITSD